MEHKNDVYNMKKYALTKIFASKNMNSKMKKSKNKDNDSKKILEDEDTYKITYKNKDIKNGMKTSQNKNSKTQEELKNKYVIELYGDEGGEEEYCSDVTYLARKMATSEKLCESELLHLHNLCVQLRHTVPPQHEIETRAGSHMPTQNEIEKFEKIVPIKRGSYSFEEDKIIAKNWKAFCKLHKWDIKQTRPFLQLRIGKFTYMRNAKERRKFAQFLADGLPERTLYSVYHRFKTLYEINLQRRYKPEEDEMIIDHLENNPSLDEKRKYVDLAKVLRRTRNSIWRRYRILKKRNKRHNNA